MVKYFLCICAFLVSCASSQKNETRIAVLKQQLDAIFSNNQNIWPGYDLKKFPVAFVLSKSKSAYLYHGGQIEVLGFHSIPKDFQILPVPFAIAEVRGLRTLVMLLDNLSSRPNEESAVHLIVHEAFHIFYQGNNPEWKMQEGPQRKGLILPIDPKARYYRWEMGRLLSQFLESGSVKYLKTFSAFYAEWEKVYEIESGSGADRTEGIAEYVAIAATSFLENRDSSVESRYAYLKKRRSEWFKKSNLDFDDEAYLLGTLSGLALDKLNVTNWQAQVNSGTSPLAILAKKNTVGIRKDDPKELAEFERLSLEKINTIDPNGNLKKFLKDFANHKFTFLAVNNKKVSSFTFSMRNTFRTPDPFNKNLFVNIYDISSPVNLVNLNGSRKILEIKKPLISLSFEETPCDRNANHSRDVFSVWALDSSLLKSGKIESDSIELHADYRLVSKSGTSWICID